MLKPLLLMAAFLCACISHAQKKDTLVIYYKTDQYSISKPDKLKLDEFLQKGWDRIFINGYTDETDEEDYNITLSKKRSGEVHRYISQKNFPDSLVVEKYFGETMPTADNGSAEGRALNRRTEIIGYRFAKLILKPKDDPMKPVTKNLDNGLIFTYRPGAMPASLAANFAEGSGVDFSFITNTTEMRQNNFYNNTTNGEILSSVLIICAGQIFPCNLDSPVLMKVPFPYNTSCPGNTIKFFNSYIKDGVKIWEEQQKEVKMEMINGRQYMTVWVDNFCGCVNFDIKIPECYETDSAWLYVTNDFKNISTELKGLNTVYIPAKLNDSVHTVIYQKDRMKSSSLSFKMYKDKKAIRTFWNQQLTTLPYDKQSKQYQLRSSQLEFSFPDAEIYFVGLKVNKDRYFKYPLEKTCAFTYLNRNAEKLLVDFMVTGPKKKIEIFRDQPLDTFPLDEVTGRRIINNEIIKHIRMKTAKAGL